MPMKAHLHDSVNALPEKELHAAARFMEFLRDVGSEEFMRALMEAAEDEEPVTAERAEGAEEAWQEYLPGGGRPWEEVRDELASE